MIKVIISLLILLSLNLPFSVQLCAEPAEELRIGGIFDLSSSAGAQWGITEKNSFLMAISDFETENPDIKISYKLEDSEYSNRKSVNAFQKLTSIDKIKYIVGPTWETFLAVSPLCESRKVICLAPSCNNGAFGADNKKYTFTAWFDERDYSTIHAEYINKSDYKKIAVFGGISPYYDAVVAAFLKTLKQKPAFVQRVQPTDRDFRTLISRVPQGIDALVIFLLGDGAAQNFYKQWAELRKERPPVYTDDTVLYFDPPLDLKKLSLKAFYSAPDLSSENIKEFETAYSKLYKEKPGAPSGSITYDETMILLDCMKKFYPQQEMVRKCLLETENYQGVSGNLSFGGKYFIQERSMKLVPVE